MTISLGFSPCPNDTFIFDAMVNGAIDTAGINFKIYLEDVQTLNEWAIGGKLDCTKISYGVLPLIYKQYAVLNAGGALGNGVGPLLISKHIVSADDVMINEMPVAIPGENTTAHLLFSLAYPNARNKIFLRYNEIEDFVLQQKGLGVIIHENRFTYQQKGLHKIIDLGNYWEQTTQTPIPLGGIVVNRQLPIEVAKQIDTLITESVAHAFKNNYQRLTAYVKAHAQEMEEAVMRQHIDLYVNQYSYNLVEAGKAAVLHLMNVYGKNQQQEFESDAVFLQA
ncbi:MAG: 1,4-dihydroxy-6-naphthoate synthase [Flavihumibacter sp.]|nr:1,4-dihydroxy-6-naphthoate synthase [Flavihumibacter sp.]